MEAENIEEETWRIQRKRPKFSDNLEWKDSVRFDLSIDHMGLHDFFEINPDHIANYKRKRIIL